MNRIVVRLSKYINNRFDVFNSFSVQTSIQSDNPVGTETHAVVGDSLFTGHQKVSIAVKIYTYCWRDEALS